MNVSSIRWQMVMRKEHHAKWRKGRLLRCCNDAWMKNGGLILWNAIAICEMFKTSWQTTKPMWKATFEAMVESHSISSRDQSRLHQFGKKVLPRILEYALFAAENLETTHYDCGYWADGKPGHVRNPSSKTVNVTEERGNFYIPNRRWNS